MKEWKKVLKTKKKFMEKESRKKEKLEIQERGNEREKK